jgi:ribulose-phosphate 3-epimerase
MQHSFVISASILSADFARLGEEAANAILAGADWIHFDVMDNHYVPNLTVGPQVCKALRKYGITAPIDVHLMARPVDSLIAEFAKAGATGITIHPECSDHLDRSLQLIRELGCKAGLAFNPATPLVNLQYVIDRLDMILLMSVNPGFANQPFIGTTLGKLKELRQFLDSHGLDLRLQVDGGVKLKNIAKIAEAGADTFVIGSGIFDTDNYFGTLANFQVALAKVRNNVMYGH